MMCRRHLLGEHVEMHMFAGAIARGMSIEGYVRGGLVETGRIVERHDELAAEIVRRRWSHRSPLTLEPQANQGAVDPELCRRELRRRCRECRKLMDANGRGPSGTRAPDMRMERHVHTHASTRACSYIESKRARQPRVVGARAPKRGPSSAVAGLPLRRMEAASRASTTDAGARAILGLTCSR